MPFLLPKPRFVVKPLLLVLLVLGSSAREGAAEELQVDLDAAKSEAEALRAQAETAEEEPRCTWTSHL